MLDYFCNYSCGYQWHITTLFSNKKIYWPKLMWADYDIELAWLDSNYFNNLNDKLKHLVFFYLVTICSCLLTSMRIFALKKIFLTWSIDFIETNAKKCSLKSLSICSCIMSESMDHVRHYQYFQFVSWAFFNIMAPIKKSWPNCKD